MKNIYYSPRSGERYVKSKIKNGEYKGSWTLKSLDRQDGNMPLYSSKEETDWETEWLLDNGFLRIFDLEKDDI